MGVILGCEYSEWVSMIPLLYTMGSREQEVWDGNGGVNRKPFPLYQIFDSLRHSHFSMWAYFVSFPFDFLG